MDRDARSTLNDRRHGIGAVGVAALVVVLFPTEVLAYLDPGTGSLLYQTLLAILLGAAFVFRGVWARLLRVVRNLFGPRRSGTTPPDAN